MFPYRCNSLQKNFLRGNGGIMKNIIVVDVGTSSLKVMLYASSGDLLFRVSQQYEAVFGHHNDVEQDTQTWRMSLVYSLEHAAEYARDNGVSINAVVVTLAASFRHIPSIGTETLCTTP